PVGYAPSHPTPAPGYRPQPQPQWNRGYAPPTGPGGMHPRPWPTPPPKKKGVGFIIAGAIVGGLALLAFIGSRLPDEGGDQASSSGTSGSSSAGPAKGGGSRPDPTPVSYKGIDLTDNYYLLLADSPPKPLDGGGTGAMYTDGDLYYYTDSLVTGDKKVGTDNGKLVLLNNAQKGSLATCRKETRFTEQIDLDQLSAGSQICIRSDAGHIGVATYRGRSGANDPSTYVSFDLTIWRNAEQPTESD
ncbi:serine/threonine protein kinase, partial [Streptomyces sp. SID14478]|nr:serine/threonine protein kinase [Streptomyces sp. SID14478]